jgi:hypothetical protein
MKFEEEHLVQQEQEDSFDELRDLLPLYEVPELSLEMQEQIVETWMTEVEGSTTQTSTSVVMTSFSSRWGVEMQALGWAAAVFLVLTAGQFFGSSSLRQSSPPSSFVVAKQPSVQGVGRRAAKHSVGTVLQQQILAAAFSRKSPCYRASNKELCRQQARDMGFFVPGQQPSQREKQPALLSGHSFPEKGLLLPADDSDTSAQNFARFTR